ncbi:MAG: oligosaccharide flippase family protein, partial [Patescibacteria group bacterium]
MWRKIAVNTIYQLLGKGFSIVANILIVALITRSLGVSLFGDYILATTVPAFLYFMADFGLNAIFLREVSKDNHHMKKFGSLFTLRLGLASLAIVLGLGYAFLYPHNEVLRLAIILSLTTVFFQAAFTSLNALFQHNLRYDLSALATVASHVAGAALAVWGYLKGFGLVYFAGTWAFSYLILVLGAFLFSQRLPERPRLSWDGAWARRLLTLSLPLGLMLVFSQVNFAADVFLLNALDSSEAVGIYRLGYKVFENILPIPLFFVNALYPVMLSDHRQSLAALILRLKQSLGLLLAAALVLILAVAPLAKFIIGILGGAVFGDSAFVLQLLVFSLPFFFLTAPLQWFLITVGKDKVLPGIYAVAAALNVSLNWFLIPRYSYFASIFATISSELVILSLLGLAYFRFKKG